MIRIDKLLDVKADETKDITYNEAIINAINPIEKKTYISLDRRFKSSETSIYDKNAIIDNLSTYLQPGNTICTITNFNTLNPSADASIITQITSGLLLNDIYYDSNNNAQLVFFNIVAINIGQIILNAEIDFSAINTFCAIPTTTVASISIVQQTPYFNNGFLITTPFIMLVTVTSLTNSEGLYSYYNQTTTLTWEITHSKFTQGVYIPEDVKKIKSIKLMDFTFCDLITDAIQTFDGARITILLHEYQTQSFSMGDRNFHFCACIRNIDSISGKYLNTYAAITYYMPFSVAAVEGGHLDKLTELEQPDRTINNNNGVFEFNPPIDVQSTMTISLGIPDSIMPLYYDRAQIKQIQYFPNPSNATGNQYIILISSQFLFKVFNKLFYKAPFNNVTLFSSIVYIEELTTDNPADIDTILFLKRNVGFMGICSLSQNPYPLFNTILLSEELQLTPQGVDNPFGFQITLFPILSYDKSTLVFSRQTNGIAGNVISGTAYFEILNMRFELEITYI